MSELKNLYEKQMEIDRQILRLYEERMACSEEISRSKISRGGKLIDKARDLEDMEQLLAKTEEPFLKKGAFELFRLIQANSQRRQYQMLSQTGTEGRLPFIAVDDIEREHIRVVFQGVEGAYSHAAMQAYFGEKVNAFHVGKWRDAMEAIADGEADYAVLPIENSSAGIVADNFDLLVEFENYIVGEQVIQCEHVLMGIPGCDFSGIKAVYSHPQALMQCDQFLDSHPAWERIPYSNTAAAARKIAEEKNPSHAAIGSAFAARLYGLEILDDHVCYNDANATRFIIVTNQRIFKRDASKISICFEVPHTSGSLYPILAHFLYNDLNMNMIESRPIPGRNWEYRFFIDFEGNLAQSSVKNALRGIRSDTSNLKILGNY